MTSEASSPTGDSGSMVITDALVFNGTDEDLVAGDVHVRDGRVIEVVARGDEPETASDDTITKVHADGNVVMPGMIDAHFHAYGVGLSLLDIESTPLSYVAVRATDRLGAALDRGFTTVRDVAGGDAGLARAVDEGRFASPRYLYTGAALSQTGGHGDPHPGTAELLACCSNMTEVVDGVEPLRLATRRRLRAGAHAIKIMTSGGVVSPTDPIRNPQYSAEEVAAVCDEATRRGAYVAAHAYSPEAIAHSVTNGVRSIEHGNLMDKESAWVMAEHEAVLVPTLVAYDALDRRGADLGLLPVAQSKNRQVLESGQRAIQLADEAGVKVGFGSDLMGDLQDEQLQGLRLQVDAHGVGATMRAVTAGNAALLRRDDLGRIAPDAVADLVILDGNPFDNPAVLWSDTRTVIQAGTLIP